MNYDFKIWHELGWAAFGGLAVAAAQVMSDFHPELIIDWHFWLITTVGALARAVGASLIVGLAKLGFR